MFSEGLCIIAELVVLVRADGSLLSTLIEAHPGVCPSSSAAAFGGGGVVTHIVQILNCVEKQVFLKPCSNTAAPFWLTVEYCNGYKL